MKRRLFIGGLAGVSAAQFLAAPAIAAETAKRTFRIMRDGDDIGSHVLDAVKGANGFEVDITIRIAVKVLGITAYRYEMDNREVWAGGRIVSVNSTTNDDGEKDRAKVQAKGEKLAIEGSRFSGDAPGETVTTSYFSNAFLTRRPWLSTQSGAPLKVDVKSGGRAGWHTVSGELNTALGYTGSEWTGCEFDAGGELASYELASQSGKIGALWAAS